MQRASPDKIQTATIFFSHKLMQNLSYAHFLILEARMQKLLS